VTYFYNPRIYACRGNKWCTIEELLSRDDYKDYIIKKSKTTGELVLEYFRSAEFVNDADTCGYRKYFMVTTENFETFEYHKVSHGWEIDYDPEWEIHNNFEYEVTDSVPFEYPSAIRDWIIIR